MRNRRQCKRRQLLYHLPVIDAESGIKLGYLVDITPEGIQLASESDFKTDSIHSIRIEGVTGCFEDTAIRLEIMIRWCKRDLNGRTWIAGGVICDKSGCEVERIIELVYRCAI